MLILVSDTASDKYYCTESVHLVVVVHALIHIHQYYMPLFHFPQYGMTALMCASSSGNTDTVHALVSAGAQVDLQNEV